MRRALLAAAAIAVAVVVQVTALNRLPFPGGSGPDLVLVLVVTIGLAGGPLPGALTGFAAGLALDLAPPGSSVLGLSALVFCLVGYGSGRMRAPLERSAWLPLSGVAVGVAAGELGYVLVGMIFGDPDLTWPAVRRLLPPSVLYDLLLSPFVLYAVVRLGRFGAGQSWRSRDGLLTGRELAGAGLAGAGVASGRAVRDTGTGRSPRLRAAAARRADGWIGGHHGQAEPAGLWVPRRRPMRLRGGVAGSAAAVPPRAPTRPAPPVHVRFGVSRRRDGALNSSPHSQAVRARGLTTGAARLRADAFRGSPSALSRDGRDRVLPAPRRRLRAGAFRGGPSALSRDGRDRVLPAPRRRLRAGAFRGGPSALSRDGRDRVLPAPRRRLRAGAFRGGPPALSRDGRDRRSRAPHLRLRRSRRGDGLVGGGVLADGGMLSPAGARRGMPGAVFLARRSPGAAGPLRSGRGYGAIPRFRSGGRGLFGWAPGRRPGGAGRGGGTGVMGARRRRLRGHRSGLGLRRGWLRGRWAAARGRRGPVPRRRWRGGSRATHRWRAWKVGNKGTGGLP